MKTLLLLLISTFVFAQNDYSKLDSLTFKSKVENLLSETGKDYKFYSYNKDENNKILEYKNVLNNDDLIYVFYESSMRGENKSLEIKGIEEWSINSITGKYLSLFPIWKKLADPKADKVNLTTNRPQRKGNYHISEPSPEYWMIRFLSW